MRVPWRYLVQLHSRSTGRVPNQGGYVPRSNTTALSGKAALLIPGHECSPPVAPSDFDRLVQGYRLN